MEVFNGAKKPLASMGHETRSRRPKDNIDLDVEDAERLGYGCHYGHYKADHPNTKDANEARLYSRKKQQTEEEQLRVKKVYVKVCPVCGKQFTTPWRVRVYCDDRCKQNSDSKKWRMNHPPKQEVKND